ncbi:MAG: hypothetical protein OXF20_08775 [Gammaproteobacteria bacterium]|nr:hypothetical protein [Gammaproteobacteria bacterium]
MKEDWAYTEECLHPLADSLGHLLAMIRPHVSARLIDGPDWVHMLDRALLIPQSMAAFPFGFEIPLNDPRPRADLGVSLVGDSLTSKIYKDRGAVADADRSDKSLAWLLDEMDQEDSLLCQVVGKKALLEFDIDANVRGSSLEPGIFLYPVDDVLASGTHRTKEIGAIHDALVFAGGWDQSETEFEQLNDLHLKLLPNTTIRAVGTFPSRKRVIRVAVTGFRKAEEVKTYLDRVGWPGTASVVAEAVTFLDDRQAYAYLGIHFDVTPTGLGPALGLSIFAQEKEWLKDIKYWIPAVKAIDEWGLAVPEKLSELMEWSTGSASLFTPKGLMMFVRGIHHLKFSIANDEFNAIKAYTFFLMMSVRSTIKA